MVKYNRGSTTKMSIRLSALARQKAGIVANNLGISTAGVILFELTKLLENPPSPSEILNLENTISLERNHFVMTVNKKLLDRVNELAKEYEVKKNVLIGLMVSDHFEKMEDPAGENDIESKQLMIQIPDELKKKMIDYSEDNFIPLNGLITFSILEGPYEGFPNYKDVNGERMFTNVPGYVRDLVNEKADDLNIRDHFYILLCLYKQFETPEGRFRK